MTEEIVEPQENVWNSGRPKRSCIRTKRLSLDDTHTNGKTYYKVEVMTGKSKSNVTDQDKNKRLRSQSPKHEEGRKDAGLIVKFKKLRNSELIQLNNEATNFLFPRKDDTMKEEHVGNSTDDKKCTNTEKICNANFAIDPDDFELKNKMEDESSADSISSDKTKKKRRTHAEAFILDNQKYYKFEMPCSR